MPGSTHASEGQTQAAPVSEILIQFSQLNTVKDNQFFRNIKPPDRDALFIAFSNSNHEQAGAILRLYYPEQEITARIREYEEKWLSLIAPGISYDVGKLKVALHGMVGSESTAAETQYNATGQAAAATASRLKKYNPQAGQMIITASDRAIDESSYTTDEKRQMKMDMRRAALEWGFSAADIAESSKGLIEINPQLKLEISLRTRQLTEELLKKLRDAEDEAQRRDIKERIYNLLSLASNTIDAAEKNLMDGKTPEQVADNLQGHIDGVIAIHTGDYSPRVIKLR